MFGLNSNNQVKFGLQHLNQTFVDIVNARGRALITPPAGTTVEITPSRKLGMRNLSTIKFRNEAKAGSLETKVLLEAKK